MGIAIQRTAKFFSDLFLKQEVPEIYGSITMGESGPTVYEQQNDTSSATAKPALYSTALIPEYLNLHLGDLRWKVMGPANQYNLGYAIRLDNEFNLDTHLKNNFKSNYRNIRKKHARLESCFVIRYQVFHGSISKSEYQYLMDCLHTMLDSRFRQRQDRNEILEEWDELFARAYQQILNKSASLFVIYDKEIPIDISLNYHLEKVLYGAVSSYDIDYYKFGLGTIEKLKIIEWCLDNNYRLLDFGYGDLDYKSTWSNYTYRFKYQVAYNPASFLGFPLARLELLRLAAKEYLKSKKINVYVNKIRGKSLSGNNMAPHSKYSHAYTCTPMAVGLDAAQLKEISPDIMEKLPIKLALNNFLYTTQESEVQTAVYELLDDPESYLISGSKNFQKITFGMVDPMNGPGDGDPN